MPNIDTSQSWLGLAIAAAAMNTAPSYSVEIALLGTILAMLLTAYSGMVSIMRFVEGHRIM